MCSAEGGNANSFPLQTRVSDAVREMAAMLTDSERSSKEDRWSLRLPSFVASGMWVPTASCRVTVCRGACEHASVNLGGPPRGYGTPHRGCGHGVAERANIICGLCIAHNARPLGVGTSTATHLSCCGMKGCSKLWRGGRLTSTWHLPFL